MAFYPQLMLDLDFATTLLQQDSIFTKTQVTFVLSTANLGYGILNNAVNFHYQLVLLLIQVTKLVLFGFHSFMPSSHWFQETNSNLHFSFFMNFNCCVYYHASFCSFLKFRKDGIYCRGTNFFVFISKIRGKVVSYKTFEISL